MEARAAAGYSYLRNCHALSSSLFEYQLLSPKCVQSCLGMLKEAFPHHLSNVHLEQHSCDLHDHAMSETGSMQKSVRLPADPPFRTM